MPTMPGGAQVAILDGISPDTIGKTSGSAVAEAYKIVATCNSDSNGEGFPDARTALLEANEIHGPIDPIRTVLGQERHEHGRA